MGNELGCHNALCYCDVSAAGVPATGWPRGTARSTQLNDAWGTAFWSQHYESFDEVLPPRVAPAFPNPTQQLDFRRFSSDQLLANFVAERDVLHELSPDVPVTTNFMVMRTVREMDYFAWAPEMDLVSNDHYVSAADPEGHRELAFSADLVRGVAGGRPWLLMEQSTSAVNWQPRNVRQAARELLRNCVQHLAHGADGCCSSSGGRPGPAPRSSTPAWCRTRAPTPGSGARSSSWGSARPDPGDRRQPRRQRRGDHVRLAGLVGLRAGLPPAARTCATSTWPTPCTGRCSTTAWGSTSCTPTAT